MRNYPVLKKKMPEPEAFEQERQQRAAFKKLVNRLEFNLAWINAIEAVGKHLFGSDTKTEDLKASWEPNREAVAAYIKTCTISEAAFLGAVLYFRDREMAEAVFRRHDIAGIKQAIAFTDKKKRRFVTDLQLNYST